MDAGALPVARARHGRHCHGAAGPPDASALTRTEDGGLGGSNGGSSQTPPGPSVVFHILQGLGKVLLV